MNHESSNWELAVEKHGYEHIEKKKTIAKTRQNSQIDSR